MNKCIFILLFFTATYLKSQSDNNNELKIEGKPAKWDTLKYHKFSRAIIVGLFQQFRNFNNTFEQNIIKDSAGISKHDYVAESKLIGGIDLSYDKFSVSFGVKTQPQQFSEGKGNTKTFNIGLKIGDNRWVLENYYRRFTGFYDKNTSNYDTAFKRTGNYYLQPNLKSSLLMSRFMYFTNYKNFSYKSGFGCNFRQLKSSATWILGGSFNVYTLSNDSSVFPIKNRAFYNDYGGLKGFQSVNIAATAGAAGTIVIFKGLFINGYFTVGPEQQWRSYNLGNEYRNLSYISWSGTGRFSTGLNLKKFYFLFSITNDYNLFNGKNTLSISSSSFTQNVSLGWRFHTKTPQFYQKFMKSKVYSYL